MKQEQPTTEYSFEDLKNAKILKPKPREWKDKKPSKELQEQYKHNEVNRLLKEKMEEDGRMNYDVLLQIGRRLQKSEIDHLSTSELYQLLQKATGTLGQDTLKHYAKILKDEGFIKFTSDGLWEILK